MTINEAISIAKKYYEKKGIPTTVSEYMKDYPKGLSRTMLKDKLKLTGGQFLKLLGSEYKDPNNAYTQLIDTCKKLNLKPIGVDETFRSKSSVEVKCLDCSKQYITTYDSLRGTIKGCKFCKSGNAGWNLRREELESIILERLNASLISDTIPKSQTGFVELQCLSCCSEYRAQVVGIVSPNSKNRATCPNCRDTDRRVFKEGIMFGSNFEYEAYRELSKIPDLKTHIKYKTVFPSCSKNWDVDFYIELNKVFIEVSTFKLDYKNYFSNIEEKKEFVESNGGIFVFLTSLKEVEDFVNSYLL